MGSGGKGGSGAKSYDYFGTVAGAICWGPVDTLQAVLIDGKQVVTGPIALEADATNLPLDGGMEKYLDSGGRLTIYRGTPTQTADAALDGHPAYRGLCYIVATRLLFGRERTTAPNIQCIVTRAPRADASLVDPSDNTLTTDGQCNPVAALAEILTGAHGLSLPLAALDAASWATAAAWAAHSTRRAFTHCSPIFTSQTEARRQIASLLEMIDATLYWTPAGKLGITLIEPGVTPGGVMTLDARHITERHSLEAPGWADVPSSIMVRYKDRDAAFKERQARVVSLLALRRRGDVPRDDTIDRPHITGADQASAHAAEAARRAAQPSGEIAISVRRPFAAGLHPGGKVKVDVDPEPGGTGLAQLCVVEEIRERSTGPVRLKLRPDTLVEATPYSPTWATPAPQAPDCPPIDAGKAVAIPLPSDTLDAPAMATLATRPAPDVVGFRVFFGDDPELPFADLGYQEGFAVRAALGAAIDGDDGDLILTLPDGDNGPDAYLAGRYPGTEIGAAQDSLLLVIANLDGNGRVIYTDAQPELEFCSIITRAVVGTDTVYSVLRARLGTAPREWTTDAACWIIPGGSIVPWSHPGISNLTQSGGVGRFRLVAFTREAEDDTVPIPEITFTLPVTLDPAPSITWAAPADSAGETDSSGDFTFEFTVTDGTGDLIRVEQTLRNLTTGEPIVFGPLSFPGSREETIQTPVSGLAVGTYELLVTATDREGHTAVDRRQIVRLGGSGAASIPPPRFNPNPGHAVYNTPGSFSLFVTVTIEAPADRIEWVRVPYGSALEPYEDYVQTVVAMSKSGIRLWTSGRVWARAGDGTDWSPWVAADYTFVNTYLIRFALPSYPDGYAG